jgi:hypothetical protein
MQRLILFLTVCFSLNCVEPYDFEIPSSLKAVVIEGLITDKSYDDTKAYPSDGRYFQVSLSYSSDVTNTRSEPIENANVVLEVDDGTEYNFIEEIAGRYVLLNETFKAVSERQYRLVIRHNGDVFTSHWEALPPSQEPAMPPIRFIESSRKVESGEVVGVRTIIDVPSSESTKYYRWSYAPSWIHTAMLGREQLRTCWINSPYYLIDYDVMIDEGKGSTKELFFIDTENNDKIFDLLSILVIQQSVTKDHYYFLEEMKRLNERNGLFDNPPFNLKSNYTSSNEAVMVVGYFGVVREQAQRWNFNARDVSYQVEDVRYEGCAGCLGPGCPPPSCVDCMRYELGEPTRELPAWINGHY